MSAGSGAWSRVMGASSSKNSSAVASSKGTSSDLELLKSLVSRFHLQCRDPGCKKELMLGNAREHIENWLVGAQCIPPSSQASGLACKSCYTLTCIGCGGEPTISEENLFTSAGVVNHCCPEGRLFTMWLLLSRFDDEESTAKKIPTSWKMAINTPQMKKSKAPPVGMASGVGYAGGYDSLYAYGQVSRSEFVDHEEECSDSLMTTTLKLVTALLPETGPDLDFNSKIPEVLCLFRLSFLFDRVAALIRNDSISDIVERRELYHSAFAFINSILDNDGLVKLLFEQRPDKKHSPGLRALSGGPVFFHFSNSSNDLLASLFTYGNNIYRQTKIFIEMNDKNTASSGQNKESTRMCKSYMRIYDRMKQKLAADVRLSSEEDLRDIWTKYSEENRVTFTDDVLRGHRYHNQLTALKVSLHKGRLTTIGKEIANMASSLPAGIFLKVADSRVDVMKVLIVGSEGSPYAGGLFTFDLFLDASYPNTPPLMTFTLLGNDSEEHSFNPNLHRGGAVCLSIINTWQGAESERWQPNKSTILSVLISVQAMILGAPLPWLNEPGYHGHGATPQAQDHNLLMQYKTVRYAMLSWLNNQANGAIWEDIIKTYWKYNSINVLQNVKEWAKGNPRLTATASKTTKKKKGKAAAAVIEPKEENLLEILEELLGPGISLEDKNEDETEDLTMKSKGKGKGKRRAPISDETQSDLRFDTDKVAGATKRQKRTEGKAKAQVKQEDEDEGLVQKWIYTGGKNQKETRGACKEFGIGAASAIKGCITKLETYVNEHNGSGTLSEDLVKKWGSFMYITDEK